jgi:hypothetical protein
MAGRTRGLAATILALLSTCGCLQYGTVQTRAAYDFNCNEAEVNVKHISGGTFEAAGCGRTSLYTCAEAGTSRSCVRESTQQQPASTGAVPVKKRRIVAVMSISDQTSMFRRSTIEAATDYLRGVINTRGLYSVVDKGRQEAALRSLLASEKRESYKDCYDQSCQIPLGQAVAADTMLRTTLTKLANFCVVSSELIDLSREAAEDGAIEKFDCSEKGLSAAIDLLVPRFQLLAPR